jgi:hypothetical protein
MRALKICLWITGLCCLSSTFGLFLPARSLGYLTNVISGEEFPNSPLLLYGVRTTSATFVVVGAFFIILAINPTKYGVLVPFSGLALAFIGVVCAITGPSVGMPLLWFLADSLSCLILGILIVVFWKKAKQIHQDR